MNVFYGLGSRIRGAGVKMIWWVHFGANLFYLNGVCLAILGMCVYWAAAGFNIIGAGNIGLTAAGL